MLDLNDIRTQTHLDSGDLTPQSAAEMSRAEAWSPHASDGLDALDKAITKAEIEKWSHVVAKAWRDEAFKARLVRDPTSALKEFGIDVPAGREVRVVENTDAVSYIALPSKPAGAATELPADDVRAIAASLRSSTAAARLPQTWADTWVAITA